MRTSLPCVGQLRGRPASQRGSALGSIVSFYKSVTVGSSETEHRDRGTTREWKHRTDCTESFHIEDTPQSRMSDHTDGPEAAVAAKERMLEEHAQGGPQGKCRKHEERGVNLDHASDLASSSVPHPSAAKKPRKAPARCVHQRRKSSCKDCGGSGICEHQRVRSRCKDCGGGSICEHKRERFRCKDCLNVKDKTAEKEK